MAGTKRKLLWLIVCMTLIGFAQTTALSDIQAQADELGEYVKAHCPKGYECSVMITDPSKGTSYVEWHIPLTRAEIAEWRAIERQQSATYQAEAALVDRFLAAHGINKPPKDCWATPNIRSDEDFIYFSVPSNPKYGTAECEKIFAPIRAKAKYRADGTRAEANQ